MPDDPYLLLGLSRDASPAEVTEAYRALVQIYHPDRYAQAPPRVQAEANQRMQALNSAYDEIRRSTRSKAAPAAPPPPRSSRAEPSPRHDPPPQPRRPAFVHYVDGARGFHNGDVAPLGFARHGGDMKRIPGATRCRKLDSELRAWFDLQQRNASMASQQMYSSWSADEQSLYAAKLGCTQIERERARSFGVPCGECGA